MTTRKPTLLTTAAALPLAFGLATAPAIAAVPADSGPGVTQGAGENPAPQPRLRVASCSPCAAKTECNPCNPCATEAACNPCAAENPCAAANPCNPCAAQNPCNPCAAN